MEGGNSYQARELLLRVWKRVGRLIGRRKTLTQVVEELEGTETVSELPPDRAKAGASRPGSSGAGRSEKEARDRRKAPARVAARRPSRKRSSSSSSASSSSSDESSSSPEEPKKRGCFDKARYGKCTKKGCPFAHDSASVKSAAEYLARLDSRKKKKKGSDKGSKHRKKSKRS